MPQGDDEMDWSAEEATWIKSIAEVGVNGYCNFSCTEEAHCSEHAAVQQDANRFLSKHFCFLYQVFNDGSANPERPADISGRPTSISNGYRWSQRRLQCFWDV